MLDKILLLLAVVTSAIVAGLFVFTEIVYQRPLPDNDIEFVKLKSGGRQGLYNPTFKLEKLTINLKSRATRPKYLDVAMEFMPYKEKDLEVLKKHQTFIVDKIIDLAVQTDAEVLNTVTGKILFENRIMKLLENRFKRPIIKNIYFTVFVIQ